MSSSPKLSNECFYGVSISLCPVVKTQLMVPSQIREVNLFSDEIFLKEICRILENLPAETRSFLVKAAEMQVDSWWWLWFVRGRQDAGGAEGCGDQLTPARSDRRQTAMRIDICHNRMLGRTGTETIIQLNNVGDVNLTILCNGNC